MVRIKRPRVFKAKKPDIVGILYKNRIEYYRARGDEKHSIPLKDWDEYFSELDIMKGSGFKEVHIPEEGDIDQIDCECETVKEWMFEEHKLGQMGENCSCKLEGDSGDTTIKADAVYISEKD